MTSPITCLVTLHGVGFMQTPLPGVTNSGYADLLHAHLSKRLGALLSDDPQRERQQRGDNGVIYVESRWLTPAGSACRELGLQRLGSWSKDMRKIEREHAPLVAHDEAISHIALTYSDLEPQIPEHGAAVYAMAMGLFSASQYIHASGLIHMIFSDIQAMNVHAPKASEPQPASLRPRTSLVSRHHRHLRDKGQPASTSSTGLMGMLRYVEDDVACYVCHNEERERVRSFVGEALLRLASRDDVGTLIFNTHSNGTVIGLDVLRQLPPWAAAKIKVFITAGSPLRKYIDLFHWGQQVESLNPIKPWYNFWDACDPVADPLEPPMSWHRGDELASPYDPKLFSLVDPNSGTSSNIDVMDIQTDNVHHSVGGGLQAHNYWDNEEEFVPQLASIAQTMVERQRPVAM